MIRHGSCLENIQLYHWVLGKIWMIVPIPVSAEPERLPHYPLLLKASFILKLDPKEKENSRYKYKQLCSCWLSWRLQGACESLTQRHAVYSTQPKCWIQATVGRVNGAAKSSYSCGITKVHVAQDFLSGHDLSLSHTTCYAPTSLMLHMEWKFFGTIIIFLICIHRG